MSQKGKIKKLKRYGILPNFWFHFSERFVYIYIGRIPSISLLPSITYFMWNKTLLSPEQSFHMLELKNKPVAWKTFNLEESSCSENILLETLNLKMWWCPIKIESPVDHLSHTFGTLLALLRHSLYKFAGNKWRLYCCHYVFQIVRLLNRIKTKFNNLRLIALNQDDSSYRSLVLIISRLFLFHVKRT